MNHFGRQMQRPLHITALLQNRTQSFSLVGWQSIWDGVLVAPSVDYSHLSIIILLFWVDGFTNIAAAGIVTLAFLPKYHCSNNKSRLLT